MKLKLIVQMISQMLEYFSALGLRLWVDQGDEDFVDGVWNWQGAGIAKLGKS